MDALLENLLEAHVQHELGRFKSKKYRQTIREEAAAVFRWINTITLREIITPEQVIGLIARNVVDLPIAGGVTELAGEMSQRVLSAPVNKKTALEDIFPRKTYDEFVDKVGSLESARRNLIHRLVNSSIYVHQISEVLFMGIKEYLLSENIIAQKVPGVASLIKIGKFAVNKTMQPVEAALEKTVKAYIEKNLGSTLRRSEKYLNAWFEDASIIEMGDEIWSSVSRTDLARYFKELDADDMEDFIVIGYEFWLYFRKTPYFKEIYTDLVHFFFDKYGDRELAVIAEEVGVTEKMVVNELTQTLSRGIQTALSIGYLEERIRARLEDFYASPAAAAVVGGGSAAPAAPKTKKPPAANKPSKKAAKK